MSVNRLAILRGLTHYDIFLSPQLPAAILTFLDGRAASENWIKQSEGYYVSSAPVPNVWFRTDWAR